MTEEQVGAIPAIATQQPEAWSAGYRQGRADEREELSTASAGTQALIEVINDLDRIMGNGSTGHDPVLALDDGTAEEWGKHIVIGLTKRGFRIMPDEAIVDAYARGRRDG